MLIINMSKNNTSAYERLKPKQRIFVDEYLITGSPYQAVLKAGYCPGGNEMTRRKHGKNLLKTDSIKQAIAEELDEIRGQRNARLNANRNWLEKQRDNESHDIQHRLTAADKLIKLDGGFVDRTEISGPEGGTLTFNIIRPEKDESENVQLEDDAETV